ncbi:MAG: hypothetical protein HQK76_06125 [Desulfobacterales bacterium]|nr:hypothetical protein [Desulfobacterales bacterium]
MTTLNAPPHLSSSINSDSVLGDKLIEPQQVNAMRGWAWIVDGFKLYKPNKWIWILNILILSVISLLIILIPFGDIILQLFFPVFIGGIMSGCYAQNNGYSLKVKHLFTGFNDNISSLMIIGGFNLLGTIIIVSFIVILGIIVNGSDFLKVIATLQEGNQINPETARQLIIFGIIAFLVGVALFTPLIMATWFAPVLITLHSLRPLSAIRLSFMGCVRNMLSYLVYGLVFLIILLTPLIIPMGLAFLVKTSSIFISIILLFMALYFCLMFFVMIPTCFASIYFSYKDIFLKKNS